MTEFIYGDAFTEAELDRIAKDTAGTPRGITLALVEQLRAARAEIAAMRAVMPAGRVTHFVNKALAGKVI